MKLNKLFLIGALALGLGLASCNNESKNPTVTPEGQSIGDTYVGLSLKFPTDGTPRAGNPDDDFNKLTGEWKGRDAIESITVYLVTEGKAVTSQHFNRNDFTGIDNNGNLNPRLAVEAVSGDKVKAYVVINDINKKITGALATAGWGLGQKVDNATKPTNTFEAEFIKAVKLDKVADVAIYDATTQKDKILMTNEELPTAANKGEISVAADISQEEAKQGTANRAEVNVTRVASRAIVTIAKDANKTIEVKRTNIADATTQTTATITITEVKYAATGGAIQFNPIEPTNLQAPADVYGHTPTGATWGEVITSAAGIFTYNDAYAGVQEIDGAVSAANLATALSAEGFSKLLLPVTHADNNYRKGNTPFFTIQATFTVLNNTTLFTDAEDLASHTGDVYYGKTDGFFYSSLRKAQLMDAKDTKTEDVPADQVKQEVVKYTNGKMYYNIWINPDQPYTQTVKKIKKSPVYRNQVYNAHITGFDEIGLSWTPNDDPTDPDDNEDPEDPDPFDPDEELETSKTFLSVQLKVLPYTLHSYTVKLGNRY